MNTKLIIAAGTLFLLSSLSWADTRKFNIYTVEASGVKMWVPSTLVVKKGDDVEIQAVSKVGKDTIHGFTIDEYKIVESADDKGKTIKFKADKAGIFGFRCHLHPPHVGGQLVVLE